MPKFPHTVSLAVNGANTTFEFDFFAAMSLVPRAAFRVRVSVRRQLQCFTSFAVYKFYSDVAAAECTSGLFAIHYSRATAAQNNILIAPNGQ